MYFFSCRNFHFHSPLTTDVCVGWFFATGFCHLRQVLQQLLGAWDSAAAPGDNSISPLIREAAKRHLARHVSTFHSCYRYAVCARSTLDAGGELA
jgi:hypothetical protein